MSRALLEWRPTAHHRRLATVAVLAGVTALLFGHAGLLVLAAPLLGALAAGHRGARPPAVSVTSDLAPDRCLEGDTVEVAIRVDAAAPLGLIEVTLQPSVAVELDAPAPSVVAGAGQADVRYSVRARRWGRWIAGTAVIRLRTKGGLTEARAEVGLGKLSIYPAAGRIDRLPVPADLPDQIGQHISRTAGSGVEFAAVRPYVPGDPPRRVNWPASLRRGQLHVTERAAERSAQVVVAVDAFSDVGPFGQSTLDRSVRGAVSVVQAYLRIGDRVGFVALGGSLSWLAPDLGGRQLYRLVEAVLSVRPDISVLDPDLDRVPPVALPLSSVVVLFTPLLDPRAVGTVTDLRQRGRAVLVVDVLTTEPPTERRRGDQLAVRLWRLDRAATRHQLAAMGVPVVFWDGVSPLQQALAEHARRPLAGSRP